MAFEAIILTALQAIRIDGLTQLFVFISSLGNCAFIWLVLAVVLFLLPDKRETGIVVGITLILTAIICCALLGNIIHRVRPSDAVIGLNAVLGVSHDGGSFPNFHVASSVASFYVLSRREGPRLGTPAFAYCVAIAIIQMYLGVAWPTDIIGGTVLGALIAVASTQLIARLLGGEVDGGRGRRRRTL